VHAAAAHARTKPVASRSFDGDEKVWNLDDGMVVTSFFAAPGYTPPK
jgi:hypothetical protein